jgi:hypothetical protein
MRAADTDTMIHASVVEVAACDASVVEVSDVSERRSVFGAGLLVCSDGLGVLVGGGADVATAPFGCSAVAGSGVATAFGVGVPADVPDVPGDESARGGASAGASTTGAGTATGATGSGVAVTGAGAGTATGATGEGVGSGAGSEVGSGSGAGVGAGSEGASPGAVASLGGMHPSPTLVHPGLQVSALAGVTP